MINAIISAGYSAPQSIIEDGKIHRFATDSKKIHSKDGWYVSFGDVGSFGSWRDSNAIVWSNGKTEITKEQREAVEREKKRAFEQAKFEAKQAAERAKRIFEGASETGESAYLVRKGITQPFGTRFIKDFDSRAFGFEKSWQMSGFLIPLRDKTGEMHSLQIITDEKKFFMPAGKTGGMFHVLGKLEGATTIIIAEGIATAQSLREATGFPVVVSFSSGNLPLVATTIRAICGNAHIIIAADNDDAGIKKATEAKSLSRADVIIAEQGDFNDVHVAKGLAYVRGCFVQDEDVDSDLWRSDLIMKHKSNGDSEVANRTQNLITILENAPEFKGRVELNTFSDQICVDKKDVVESTAIKLKAVIEQKYIPEKVSTNDVIEAMHVVAENNTHHPIQEYLNGLKWDGIGRICTTLLIEMGLPITTFNQSAIRYFFISAVKRIFQPACKVDMMLILESIQGLGKSTFFKTLFMEWYAEVTSSLNDKDFFMGLRGVWCADFGELDQFSKADSTRIKQVITMTDDHYRPAYARLTQKFPRQCIFVGGTNREDWQKDETGGRRFLPIKITKPINNDWVQENRNQLWAEAVHLMNTVKGWWNVANASEEQEARYEGDSWEGIVHDYLIGKSKTTTTEILSNALKIEVGRHDKSLQMRIGKIMNRNDSWERKRDGKTKLWGYERKG